MVVLGRYLGIGLCGIAAHYTRLFALFFHKVVWLGESS